MSPRLLLLSRNLLTVSTSPLVEGKQSILKVDDSAERAQIERLEAFRKRRNESEVEGALRNLREVLSNGGNVIQP